MVYSKRHYKSYFRFSKLAAAEHRKTANQRAGERRVIFGKSVRRDECERTA